MKKEKSLYEVANIETSIRALFQFPFVCCFLCASVHWGILSNLFVVLSYLYIVRWICVKNMRVQGIDEWLWQFSICHMGYFTIHSMSFLELYHHFALSLIPKYCTFFLFDLWLMDWSLSWSSGRTCTSTPYAHLPFYLPLDCHPDASQSFLFVTVFCFQTFPSLQCEILWGNCNNLEAEQDLVP